MITVQKGLAPFNILIVDDEADIRDLMSGILNDEGYQTQIAYNTESVMDVFAQSVPDLVLLDIWLRNSSLDGLSILDILKREYPEVPIVMISGHGTIESAVSSIQRGAYDFIEKPFKIDRLLLIVQRALEASFLKRKVPVLVITSSKILKCFSCLNSALIFSVFKAFCSSLDFKAGISATAFMLLNCADIKIGMLKSM